MAANPFRGLGIALPTPFRDSDGGVDYMALKAHLSYLKEGGVDFMVALGTTAETPTLTADERRRVLATVVECCDGMPVVAGIGGNCTRAVVDEIERTDFTGVSAILSVAPYYNKPRQEGLYRHFAAVAQASPVGVILYNVPSRTGVNIEAATALRLASDFPDKIIAIKEASGRLDQAETIVNRRHEGFNILAGDDSLAHAMIKAGAEGVISVLGNVYPALFGRMIHATMDGDTDRAAMIHQQFSALYTLLFRDGNPAGVKAALHCVMPGYGESLRLPLIPVDDTTRAEISEFLTTHCP